MKSVISYTKEVPIYKIVLGVLVLIIGILGFLQNVLIGLTFVVVGANLLSSEGSEIDLSNKTYRNINTLFGLKFGEWMPIPEFEYVSVFFTAESQRINVSSATTVIRTKILHLNLFYQGSKHITFYKSTDKEDAFKVANHISRALNIKILDATEADKVWL